VQAEREKELEIRIFVELGNLRANYPNVVCFIFDLGPHPCGFIALDMG